MIRTGIAILFFTTMACKKPEVKPIEMVGKYSVHLELDQKNFDKKAVHDSIKEAMTKAKDDLAKAKEELDAKMDTAFIDTSSFEGKMEYFAKSFAKSMASFGKDLGELGILLGEAAGDVATGAMDFTESLLQKIKLDIELLPNGKLETSSEIANKIKFIGSSWEVKNDSISFKDDNGLHVQTYLIQDKTDKGFVLVHDKYRLIFNKK
ncbi:MAG: hypothetical protein IPM34_04255 [Saprospiraceae bacterium]|nr:hypothetical protein [Saprospiraceae bacterium]